MFGRTWEDHILRRVSVYHCQWLDMLTAVLKRADKTCRVHVCLVVDIHNMCRFFQSRTTHSWRAIYCLAAGFDLAYGSSSGRLYRNKNTNRNQMSARWEITYQYIKIEYTMYEGFIYVFMYIYIHFMYIVPMGLLPRTWLLFILFFLGVAAS